MGIGRAGSRPGRRPAFLLVQASRQRSPPRLPGPAGCLRCGRPAGPVAKLAARFADGVGQRDRTTPGEPSSLGGTEGNEIRLGWWRSHSLDVQGLGAYPLGMQNRVATGRRVCIQFGNIDMQRKPQDARRAML